MNPGIVSGYIEELPEADQANALAIVNDWFDNLDKEIFEEDNSL